MTSLIQYFRNQGLTFDAYASSQSTTNYIPNSVFDNKYFETKWDVSGQWWQVSFSKSVIINSYTIKCGASYLDRPYKWMINASMNNKTWETIETRTKDAGGNTEVFSLNNLVSCMYFRLVLVSVTNPYYPNRL